jgi:xylulokinase
VSDLFLGIDCSTQSLTGLIVEYNKKRIIYNHSINYDFDLPQYNTQNGVLISEEGKVVHSNPLMWVDALELFLRRLVENKVPISSIKAIAGSGQQHGTVYLNNTFEYAITSLDYHKSLVEQLKNVFTRHTSPIWMDSSTSKQCKEIREYLGGKKLTIQITGSDTFERFSGPQIRKFYQEEAQSYQKTSSIHLVSSFLSSILLGNNSPIDYGDGAGMNLMNIKTMNWDDKALDATAPDLRYKLPPLSPSYAILGNISEYFVKKYGFSPDTILIPWSGDNPNSLIGVGVINKGTIAISLGTSDTYFSYLTDISYDPKGEGHIFGAPTGDYMSLICYKNGSLAREKVKDQFNLTWKEFSEILTKTPPGNYGKIMLPYFFPEIVPLVLNPKVYRFGFDEYDLRGNVRAIIEAQFLSMKLHSEWIEEKPHQIFATGGASENDAILQIAADIFNLDITKFDITNSAALGAVIRSIKAYYDHSGKSISWKQILDNILNIQQSRKIKSRPEYRELYHEMVELYRKYENYVLYGGTEPEHDRVKFFTKYFS